MSTSFEKAAVKLSQGPLGIIALFIVLVHAFASLVVGFASDIGELNRTVLVWFLVLFPVVVFASFAWLVRSYHTHLYPPQAYRDERIFQVLAYGNATFDQSTPAPEARANPAAAGGLRHDKPANLFWLGHDLMWAADTLLRSGPPQHVVIGLEQARHHMNEAGLGHGELAADLDGVRDAVLAAAELDEKARDDHAGRIGLIIDRIGSAVEAEQGDFRVPPHWKRTRA